MKKLILLSSITIIFFGSCEKEETTFSPEACFNIADADDNNPVSGMPNDTISFNNCSDNADYFAWEFGDGSISTDENPSHVFTSGGDFEVKLIATTETHADTIIKTITIGGNANFISHSSLVNHSLSEGFQGSYTHETDSSGRWHNIVLWGAGVSFDQNNESLTGDGPVVILTFTTSSDTNQMDVIAGDYSNSYGKPWTDPQDANSASDHSWMSVEMETLVNSNWEAPYISLATVTEFIITENPDDTYSISVKGDGDYDVDGNNPQSGAIEIQYTGNL